MNNEPMNTQNTLPATLNEMAANIERTAEADGGFDKLVKFKKGKYYVGDDVVAPTHEFVAHVTQWTKGYVKFVDGKLIERQQGKVCDGYVLPERASLGDNDQNEWPIEDGRPKDPWVEQSMFPLEDTESGELFVFTTSSVGGRIAISDLAKEWTRRLKRQKSRACPIVTLASVDMKTAKYGAVARPHFRIVGWDDQASNSDAVEITPPSKLSNAFDDTIPF
jgi:hypothetical protein